MAVSFVSTSEACAEEHAAATNMVLGLNGMVRLVHHVVVYRYLNVYKIHDLFVLVWIFIDPQAATWILPHAFGLDAQVSKVALCSNT